VRDNKESTERQYALVHRAAELGWSAHEIEVIDDDQGLSGKSVEHRLGFPAVVGGGRSRPCRTNSRLGDEPSGAARIETGINYSSCAESFARCLPIKNGIYDPTDYNDRLLPGD